MQKRRPDEALDANHAVMTAWLRATLIAAVVLVLDQITKSWAERNFYDSPQTVFGPVQFTLTYNSGVAFGIGSGMAPIVIAVVVLGVVIFMLGRHITVNRLTVTAAGLVIGGAVGNLFDRLVREPGGAVVDFIDIGAWPVFNLADVAVVTGACLLAIWGSRRGEAQ